MHARASCCHVWANTLSLEDRHRETPIARAFQARDLHNASRLAGGNSGDKRIGAYLIRNRLRPWRRLKMPGTMEVGPGLVF
jgi:hypothetical protein